jgi:hypothetical protein
VSAGSLSRHERAPEPQRAAAGRDRQSLPLSSR